MTSDNVYTFITDKSVPGIDKDRYIVLVTGTIFDLKMQRYPKPFTDEEGYIRYHLHTTNGFKIVFAHRIVAIEFAGFHPNPEKNQIDHVDTRKSNNGLYNLEWVTPHENNYRALRNGLSNHVNNIITEDDVHFICQQLKMGKSYCEISDMLYTKTGRDLNMVIGKIYRGETWKHISKLYAPFPSLDNTYYLSDKYLSSTTLINNEIAHEICRLIQIGMSDRDIDIEISTRYNCKKSLINVINNIRRFKTWKHISKDYIFPSSK